jgi:glycosyltransferase involved in cell wall biosynthesis
MSVYYKENPKFLHEALDSIYVNQTMKPDEYVIVKDGKLTEELDKIIYDFSLKTNTKIVNLETNSGLGVALSKGVEACTHEIIARMDGDDIAFPERFEKQLNYLKSHANVSFLSAHIDEFSDETDSINGIRKVPIDEISILHFAKSRNPMNHMAVMFRKKDVLSAGNYQTFHGYEDYYLWVRMLMNGCIGVNLDESLVWARVGNNMLSRRQGIKFFKQEIKLQRKFYEMEFINSATLLKNILTRALPRLFPIWALSFVYKTLRNKK